MSWNRPAHSRISSSASLTCISWPISTDFIGGAGEYPEAIQRIRDGSIQVEPLLSKIAPLSEGAEWFHKGVQPGNGLLKVVLKP